MQKGQIERQIADHNEVQNQSVPLELLDRYSDLYSDDKELPYIDNHVSWKELAYIVRRRASELAEVLTKYGYKVPISLKEVQDHRRYPDAYFRFLQSRNNWAWRDMPDLLDDIADYWLNGDVKRR